MRLAEGVYEQTQDLGPTPLQGRLNYLHQLGKVTLRDRRESLNSLPRKREEMEFAVSAFILAYTHCKHWHAMRCRLLAEGVSVIGLFAYIRSAA